MGPEISQDVKGALLSEGIFPADVESMPQEIRDILSRRPELLKEAMDRSRGNAMKKEEAGGDIFSDDLITIQEEPANTPQVGPMLSQVQRNMVSNRRGYAERYAGAAAAAELNGLKVASFARHGKEQYEDDELDEEEGDGVGLLGSTKL